MKDNQISIDKAFTELENLKESDPEQYASSLREFNETLQSYNEKVASLIAKLES